MPKHFITSSLVDDFLVGKFWLGKSEADEAPDGNDETVAAVDVVVCTWDRCHDF
jgi:hypothetical protein